MNLEPSFSSKKETDKVVIFSICSSDFATFYSSNVACG